MCSMNNSTTTLHPEVSMKLQRTLKEIVTSNPGRVSILPVGRLCNATYLSPIMPSCRSYPPIRFGLGYDYR